MTFLDWDGELQTRVVSSGDIAVRMPLSVSAESWRAEFVALVEASHVRAQVDDTPEGKLLTVMVPVAASPEETAELLDGALRLVDEARARAETRLSAVAAIEEHVQEWWESRRRSSRGHAVPE